MLIVFVLLLFFGAVYAFFPTYSSKGQEEQKVIDTLEKFKAGIEKGDLALAIEITTDDFYPFFKGFYESLAKIYSQHDIPFPMEIGHLKILKDGRAKVELYINPAKNLFVFTLNNEAGLWKISHNEGIRFPLYAIPGLPYRDIYEIPPERRKFMTAEMELNFKTWVYFSIKERRGQEEAIHFFLDGPGYKVAMDAWLPFMEGAAQFAFYFVIMESNFYGSKCEVLRADDDEAEVLCHQLTFLEVLKRGHAVPKFPFDEYKRLFTTIMKNRAQHCGLDLEISYNDTSCRMKIKSK